MTPKSFSRNICRLFPIKGGQNQRRNREPEYSESNVLIYDRSTEHTLERLNPVSVENLVKLIKNESPKSCLLHEDRILKSTSPLICNKVNISSDAIMP